MRDDPIPDDPINEELGADRIRGLVSVRDLGGAPGTQCLMGSHVRMVDDASYVALCLWSGPRWLSRFERPIHRVA